MDDLSEKAKDLIRILKKRNVEKDSVAGIILEIMHSKFNDEDKYSEMLAWIQANENAGQEEIFMHLDTLLY